ncbi:MAG: carbamate kinase, partial [Anaerovorax sp.]
MSNKETTSAKIVIALGGNALQQGNHKATAQAQLLAVRETCQHIAEINCRGYEVAIVHGNGPQIGRIILASEAAKGVTPPMPFDVCGAMSQGYIGYHIQQGLKYALNMRNKNTPVITVVTQMVVEENDLAFQNPTKPIGTFYTEEEAEKIAAETGYLFREDSGRGWRRVVASPMPRKIVEIDAVNKLWDSSIVITCGGGGIPVIEKSNGMLEGTAAVIDKDFAAELLAETVQADILMILTEVEKVSLDYNKPNQRELDSMSLEEAAQYVEEGHFAPGSMLPKIQACMKFVRENPAKK